MLRALRGLDRRRTSRDTYECALVQNEPLFVEDIAIARGVLLAPHRIPIWRWVSLKSVTVQELKELREDRLLSYGLDQRDLLDCEAATPLHIVKSSAHDERGYSSVNPGTVHQKAAKKPRTTYAPAVVSDPRSQQPSGSQPGAGLPPPTSSVTRDNLATTQAAGASQSVAALGRPAPHGSGALRSDQGEQEEPLHVFEYEAPSQSHPSGPSTSGRDSFVDFDIACSAIEIALGMGPGGPAATQAGKLGVLDILRQDVNALGRETRELHGSVDRRVPAFALKKLCRGLDALSHQVHGRIPFYEPQGCSYHSAYGYGTYGSASPTFLVRVLSLRVLD
ncbi:ATP-binding cassette (ABC) Superfamily [Phytophthora palmivora]|uniref:ATP-binding cassette (ABC) Superfamily n=1 Tax=Phytophthora palmivora TaxID=4796 RepID=A0A2P4YMS6_9STRA|nr:ATP-binding cassette (ABC) Superfamily [Phytophthora palmivora]